MCRHSSCFFASRGPASSVVAVAVAVAVVDLVLLLRLVVVVGLMLATTPLARR